MRIPLRSAEKVTLRVASAVAPDSMPGRWLKRAVRGRLLTVRGIGPETADAITLYAADLPTFVVDTYARRLLAQAVIGQEAAHLGMRDDCLHHRREREAEDQRPQDFPSHGECHPESVQNRVHHGAISMVVPMLIVMLMLVSMRFTTAAVKRFVLLSAEVG